MKPNMVDSDGVLGGGGSPGDQVQNADQTPSPVSDPIVSLEKRLAQLEGDLRGLRSVTDKGMAGVNKEVQQEVKGLKQEVAKYKKLLEKYPDPDDAARAMFLDRLMESGGSQVANVQVPPQPVVGSQQGGATVDVEGLLELLQLPNNDPEVLAVLRDTNNPLERVAKFQVMSKARKDRTVAPNPAAVSQTTVGSGPPAKDLAERYHDEMSKAAPGSEQALQIRRKYRKEGLNI